MELQTTKASGALQEKTIAVAVKNSRNSQLALKWAVTNLIKKSQSLTLVHVRHKDSFKRAGDDVKYVEMEAFCGPDVAEGLEQAYRENLVRQSMEIFSPMKTYCKKKNVRYDEVVLEDESVPQALADFVLKNNFDVLVIGAGSKGGIIRKLKGPDTASRISKNIPYFCSVYTIHKGGMISLKSPSSASQSPSSPYSVHCREPDIGVQSPNTQMENRISVSGGASLLQPNPLNEFDFRSPLKDCRDSDFTWIGQCPSETDISFVSSDRMLDDHESPRLPISRFILGQGSFKSSATTHRNLMESRRLQLEPLDMKKVHGADQDAFVMRLLALKTKSIKLEEIGELTQSPTALKVRSERMAEHKEPQTGGWSYQRLT